MIGLLTVFNKRNEAQFTSADQRLLDIIAAQSAHVIENARLYREEQELIRFREEMRFASEIQIQLLPKEQPVLMGYKIAGKSIPASEVGGDFYDFISIDANRFAFWLGDVSGKGIPAAILMANIQATLRGQTLTESSCKDCVALANTILYHNTAPGKFATLFYGIIDISTNELTYCNAGHNIPLFLSKDNKISPLENGGMAIGIMPWVHYEHVNIPFKPGDRLVLFSDGIPEAMNSNEDFFGEERLTELVIKNRDKLPDELIDLILKEISVFSGSLAQTDDITLVIITRD
jgi:sigma-B regulation protein RsbU (phosphoserine phosphatase)